MNPGSSSLLVAIVGGSGAGKSWLVDRLCGLLGDHAAHLALDDFYLDRSHLPPARRARLNFDVPRAIDWNGAARVLRDCRAGRSTSVPRYDFSTYCRVSDHQRWEPRPLVFVEGLWLLRRPELRRMFDLKIFLDTPRTLRQARRLRRDVAERGYTAAAVRAQLQTRVVPMHRRYVEPQKRWADVVLAQPFRAAEVRQLADALWAMIANRELMASWMHETFRAELSALLIDHEYRN